MQNKVEDVQNFEEENLYRALRSTYAAIIEIGLSKDAPPPRVLYRKPELFNFMIDGSGLNFRLAVKDYIHPQDQKPFFKMFSRFNMKRSFKTKIKKELQMEVRVIADDGKWDWIEATAVPFSYDSQGNCQQVLFLIKDVTEKKAQESQQKKEFDLHYDRALRKIYDELYELNLSEDSYRPIYHAKDNYFLPSDIIHLSDAIQRVADQQIHPADKERFLQFLTLPTIRKSCDNSNDCLIGEFRKLKSDASYHWFSLSIFRITSEVNGDEKYLMFLMDIDSTKQAEALREHNHALERARLDDQRYRIIVDQTDTLVFERQAGVDSDYISPEIAERFIGHYDGRHIETVWREDHVIHPDDLDKLQRFLAVIDSGGNYAEMKSRFMTRSGIYLWCKVALTAIRDESGALLRLIGTMNDVDEMVRSIETLRYKAEYDTLTGLYNMSAFYNRTHEQLINHPDRQFTIVRLNIDRFKMVNELYGIQEGDRLLKYIADLFKRILPKDALYARLNADIYCFCVDKPESEVIGYIQQISADLERYPLAYKIVPLFGICRVDRPETPVNVLCDWANLALRTIKGNCLTNYAFYDQALRNRILEEKSIENEMHDALEDGQFQIYYQPKVDIITDRVVGAEALVRWRHPVDGLIPPDRFIPLFEKNGFIIKLDEYVWEQVCIQLRKWLDKYGTLLPISVNVSRMHIHDEHFCEKMISLVKKYEIPTDFLELELTESAFLENESKLRESMDILKRHGFHFSMDDFGAGYSSLNLLKDLPLDTIKLDRGFFNETTASRRGKTIIKHAISMANEMNLGVIAEGVENADQASFLVSAGCALAQGFYYARPMPIEQFEEFAVSKSGFEQPVE